MDTMRLLFTVVLLSISSSLEETFLGNQGGKILFPDSLVQRGKIVVNESLLWEQIDYVEPTHEELSYEEALDEEPGEGSALDSPDSRQSKSTITWKREDFILKKRPSRNRTETKVKKKSAKTLSRKNYKGACYPRLGCFDSDSYGLNALPDPALASGTFFLFYTRKNLEGIKFTYLRVEEVAKLVTEPMELIIVVHGYASSSAVSWTHLLKEKSMENTNCAVIIVDWEMGARATYNPAVTNSQIVGRQIARILYQLKNFTEGNISPKRTHWMGHSLGAQMTIYFWDYLSELTDGEIISKITAFDPAAPFYESNNIYLNTSMARFVEVIHTSSGTGHGTSYGMSIPAGHIDFYMNGGDSPQPGCSVTKAACSHSRSYLYYIEAIDINSACTMFSYSCIGGRSQYEANECDVESDNWSAITFNSTQTLPGRGIQFINTKPKSPFCIAPDETDSDKQVPNDDYYGDDN